MALCLGTAQLGQAYGIFKKPEKETAFKILEAAIDSGIEFFDTAPMYGEAESLIGTFLKANGLHIKCITKIPSYKGNDHKEFVEMAKRSVGMSQRTLGVSNVWGGLIHDPQNAKDFSVAMMGLRAFFVGTGILHKFGVSMYEPSEVSHRMMGIYQIPLSMRDTRFLKQVPPLDFFWNGNTIMVRSIYLQGKITEHATAMAFVKQAISKLTRNYMIVVGAENPEQVRENRKMYDNSFISDEDYNKIMDQDLPDIDEIDPRRR